MCLQDFLFWIHNSSWTKQIFLNKKDPGLHSSSGNYELQSFGQVRALISLVIKMEMKIPMLQDCLKFKTNVCVCACMHVCARTLSHVLLFATPWIVV